MTDEIANLIALLLLAALGLLPIAGELYLQLRAWWRTRRNRRVATVINPRCVECARPLELQAPFTTDAAYLQRCPSCGVHLHCRQLGNLWQICTVAEMKRQGTSVLPAVGRVRRAARAVARFLQPRDGMEPGESTLPGSDS
jgi:hypothetical protein